MAPLLNFVGNASSLSIDYTELSNWKSSKLVADILFTTISDNQICCFFLGLDFTISAKFTKIDWLCLQAWPVVTGVDAQKSITSGVARSFCSYYILFFFWPRIAENTWQKDNLNILRESFEHHPETHLLNHPMTFGVGVPPGSFQQSRPRMSQQITWTWMLCRGGPRKTQKITLLRVIPTMTCWVEVVRWGLSLRIWWEEWRIWEHWFQVSLA